LRLTLAANGVRLRCARRISIMEILSLQSAIYFYFVNSLLSLAQIARPDNLRLTLAANGVRLRCARRISIMEILSYFH
jgi:hypothetical protein